MIDHSYIAPSTFQSLVTHAEELIGSGRFREAQRLLTQFLGRRTLDPTLMPAIASLYLKAGKPDRAVRTMQRAIEKSEPNAELRNVLGLIYAALGRDGESREQFQEALAIDGSNAESLRNLAFILHRGGDRSEAYALLVQCFDAAPLSVDLRLICGTLLELDGRLDDAANCYRDAMEIASVGEQVELASTRLYAVGVDRTVEEFEDVMARLRAEFRSK